jgi:hypothetical protein
MLHAPLYLIFLDMVTVIFGEAYKLMKLLLMQSFQAPLLGPNITLSTLSSYTLNVWFSLV